MKTENEFLQQLEGKAREQRKLLGTEIVPEWARGVADWLAINPWRVLIPVSGVVYMSLRLGGGVGWREFILGLFGGFAK